MNTEKFTLTGGIYLSACTALSTIASLLNTPGFPQFTKILVDIYGPWNCWIYL